MRKIIWDFFNLAFVARFFVEFFKEHQALSNNSALTMGQYLSIPLVLVGIIFGLNQRKLIRTKDLSIIYENKRINFPDLDISQGDHF